MQWIAVNHIKDFGQLCTVNGSTESYVILRKVGARTDLEYVENFREGLILLDSNFASGDLLEVDGVKYLGITSQIDQVTGQIFFQAAKINTSLEAQRFQATYDDFGNVISEGWDPVCEGVPAYAGIIFQRTTQQDPGLFLQQITQVTIQEFNDVRLLDRVVFGGQAYRVDIIDIISSPGNKVLDLSVDARS